MPKVSDDHRDRRRQQILSAALACFERSGFHPTSMHDIVRESGLSAGAIYTYFDGKEAIIEAVASERHARERALLEEALSGDDVRAAVRQFLERYFDWLDDPEEQRWRRVNVQVWAEALQSEPIRAIVLEGLEPRQRAAERLRDAQVEGAFPAHIDPKGFADLLLALLQGFMLQLAWQPDADRVAFRHASLAVIDAALAS